MNHRGNRRPERASRATQGDAPDRPPVGPPNVLALDLDLVLDEPTIDLDQTHGFAVRLW
jgi:hypothetical protein